MNHKQKIKLFISTLIIFGGGVFVWYYWENYKGTPASLLERAEGPNSFSQDDEENADEEEEALDPDDPFNATETDSEAKKTSAYVVDQAVCDAECVQYQNDTEALSYCQAVCGLAPTEGGKREAPSDCSDKTETAKDICFRDKAVAEKNAEFCNEIIDQSLRTSCHNRLAEEYFD